MLEKEHSQMPTHRAGKEPFIKKREIKTIAVFQTERTKLDDKSIKIEHFVHLKTRPSNR